MKSKHRTYGKEAADCGFDCYRLRDNFRYKSTIAAIAVATIVIK